MIYGDGTQTRDYVFVEDVVRVNLLSITGKEGIYNIGTGIETSVNQIIELYSKILNKEIKPMYTQPRKGEVFRISLDTEKANKELGFSARYNLEQGLLKTIDWYKEKF